MITLSRPAAAQVQRRYLRSKCFALAHAMSKASGLPIWGGFDARGEPHHAFVYDAQAGLGYDIRGGLPLEEIMRGSAAEDGTTGPLSEETIMQHIGSYDPDDLRQARKDVKAFMIISKAPRKAAPSAAAESAPLPVVTASQTDTRHRSLKNLVQAILDEPDTSSPSP
jgi:hypothetical protein